MRVALAFRAFFAVLFQKDIAERIRESLDGTERPKLPASPPVERSAPATTAPSPRRDSRSDAITLLMVLQRDARLIDLITESLENYSDAQIGGAARPVLQDARKTLERVFGLQRCSNQSEGESIEIPENASPIRWRLIGRAAAKQGVVAHSGWQATKVDLPKWTGQPDDEMVLAPIEVDTGS